MFEKFKEKWKAARIKEEERIQKEIEEREQYEKDRKALSEILSNNTFFLLKKNDGTAGQVIEQATKEIGDISDGYHTFNELYEYRMLYNAGFFNELARREGNPFDVHKSIKHHDGEECFGGGWFIVMANLPTGQISNHYPIQDWNMFALVPSKEVANEWDGHSPQEAAKRLREFLDLQNYNTAG